jgi:DNA-binding PadR family transcriptional regulator
MYAEPKRLEQLGYVRSEKRPGKTRERTFYTLTERGCDAPRQWLREPPGFPRIQNEAVPKLIAGDILGDDEQLLDALLGLRDELADQQQKLDRARERLEALPIGGSTSCSSTTSATASSRPSASGSTASRRSCGARPERAAGQGSGPTTA